MQPSEAPPPAMADEPQPGRPLLQQQQQQQRRRRLRPGAAALSSLVVAVTAVAALSCGPGQAFLLPPATTSPASAPGGSTTCGTSSWSSWLPPACIDRIRRDGPTSWSSSSSSPTALAYSLQERNGGGSGGSGGGGGRRGPSAGSSSSGSSVTDVEALLDEVERMQTRAFKEVGLLGRPFPISALERLKTEGRLGTGPERDALARAREVVGDREGQGAMLEALRLRAMAKRLRAEADLAEVELANEKVNATVRGALQGVDVGMELLSKPRSGIVPADPTSKEAALDVARRAFSRLLALEATTAPPLSTVEARADLSSVDGPDEDEDRELVLQRRVPGQRPSWIRDDDLWDEDLPDLTLKKQPQKPPPPSSSSAPSSTSTSAGSAAASEQQATTTTTGAAKRDGREAEDAALMRGVAKPPGSSSAQSAAEKLQDDFLREVEQQALAAMGSSSGGAAANETTTAATTTALNAGGEDDETFYSIGGTNASDIGIIAYELVGTNEPLPGLPDVKFRRIRRKELNPDESFQRALGAIQQMIEADGQEEGLLEMPDEATMNLTALMLDESGAGGLGGEPVGRVKDGLLESFLQSNFPDEEVTALPEEDWSTLRSEVFGRTAGGAFTLQYVIDFDARFHVLVGDAGTGPSGAPLGSQALAEVLNKRLEYFNLTDTVSLFLLRFPPETLFELEDIAMDAAMDSFDDSDAVVGPGAGDDDGGRGRGRGGAGGPEGLDEEGMLEEGVDLRLMGQLVPRFLGKLAEGRVAILALPKRTAPDDSSVLDDPVVRASSLAMGTVLQVSETLRYVAPPLFERLDQDLLGFLSEAPQYPALTQGVPPVLLPLAVLILLHEAGHWIAAKRSGVKLGGFVPLLDPWFGYLGSLTQLESYPPTRRALFDVAAAGPLLGSLASYAAFAAGLWLTKLGPLPPYAPALPIPLLTASTFLAELTNAVLPGAFAVVDPEHAALTLHPLALAGFWGVLFNALQLLPLGRLDGARMVEALLGKRTAAAASSFTFWGTVAAGLWQGRPDLFFAGMVVRFFWHRKAVPCQDEVLDVGGDRFFLGVAGLILMLGAFIPATDRFIGDATYLLNNL